MKKIFLLILLIVILLLVSCRDKNFRYQIDKKIFTAYNDNTYQNFGIIKQIQIFGHQSIIDVTILDTLGKTVIFKTCDIGYNLHEKIFVDAINERAIFNNDTIDIEDVRIITGIKIDK